MELQVIAAVLLGGVSIFGGRGALHGVIAGVLLIGTLGSALRLAGRHQRHHQRHHRTAADRIRGVVQPARMAPGPPGRRHREEEGASGGAVAVIARDHASPTTHRNCTKEGNNDVRTSAQGAHAVAAAALAVGVALLATGCAGAGGGDRAVMAGMAATPTCRSRCCPRTSATRTSTPRPGRRGGHRGVRRHVRGGRPHGGDRPTSQVQYIQTAAQQGAGGLIVSANDPEAICDALERGPRRRGEGRHVRRRHQPGCRDLFINQATAEGIAKVQVDLIAEQIGDGVRSRSCRRRRTRRTRTRGSR